jgi:(E)-4-hydroxy-3-methylbut-2-enyl-diphosphate synthase
MTKTKTTDIDATVQQIRELKAIDAGFDKIRINPGNIGDEKRIKAVLDACKANRIPIRIGVNAGSLEKEILKQYGHPNADAMVESALHHIRICEKNDFYDIIVSLKASDVPMMIDAYRKLAAKVSYPLHIGVTEAGNGMEGLIKSSVGIGTLLAEGIGDTIRVSLTENPLEEVKAAKEILKSLNLRKEGVNLVSCPTCGRLEVDLIPIVNRVKQKLSAVKEPLTIALMGCVVNGPGEAREADFGVACGKDKAIIFKHGQKISVVKAEDIEDTLLKIIQETI